MHLGLMEANDFAKKTSYIIKSCNINNQKLFMDFKCRYIKIPRSLSKLQILWLCVCGRDLMFFPLQFDVIGNR